MLLTLGKRAEAECEKIRLKGYPVVVVDDGSKDETAGVAETAGAMVIRHPFNLGQGAALQTGIDYALEQAAEVVVTFDADGQHRPQPMDRGFELNNARTDAISL
jgi:glycosyltransferase involved in cell wall biosynthesis